MSIYLHSSPLKVTMMMAEGSIYNMISISEQSSQTFDQ